VTRFVTSIQVINGNAVTVQSLPGTPALRRKALLDELG
jgi:hypothetical protein